MVTIQFRLSKLAERQLQTGDPLIRQTVIDFNINFVFRRLSDFIRLFLFSLKLPHENPQRQDISKF